MGWVSLREDIVERLTRDLNAFRNDRSSGADEVQELKIHTLIKTCESILRTLSKDLDLATDPIIDFAKRVPELEGLLAKQSEEITGLQKQSSLIEEELGKERENVEALTKQLDKTSWENSRLKEKLEEAEVKMRMMDGKKIEWKDEVPHTNGPQQKQGKRKSKAAKGDTKLESPRSINDFAKTLSSKWTRKT